MGRSPDYKAGLAVSLGAWPEYFEPFTQNATHWYHQLADQCSYLNPWALIRWWTALRRCHENKRKCSYVRSKSETMGSWYAAPRWWGPAAAFTHYNFVFNYGARTA